MKPDGPRATIVGEPTGPSTPFPLRMSGKVISGFGRGSKELGIPTANIPVGGTTTPWINNAESGIYFGWAAIRLPPSHPDLSSSISPQYPHTQIHPMVMSIGYNPFFKNTVRSAEVHLLHDFAADFYGVPMRLLILGFVRPEYDYVDMESLVKDINVDIEVTKRSLEREQWGWARIEDGSGWLRRCGDDEDEPCVN